MVTLKNKKVERYIWGLSSQIQGHVLASNPSTFDSAKRLAQRLIDHEVRQGVITPTAELTKMDDYKRKSWNGEEGPQTQEASKRQQIVVVHATTTSANPAPTSRYADNLPKCNKCNFNHTGACRRMHCKNCNRKGHTTRFCRVLAQPISQIVGCYRCGETGHFQRDCPITRNPARDGRILMITAGETTSEPL